MRPRVDATTSRTSLAAITAPIAVIGSISSSSAATPAGIAKLAAEVAKWAFTRKGVLSLSPTLIYCFWRSHPDVANKYYADLTAIDTADTTATMPLTARVMRTLMRSSGPVANHQMT